MGKSYSPLPLSIAFVFPSGVCPPRDSLSLFPSPREKGSAYHLCASCHLGHANIKPSRPSASKTPSTHTHTQSGQSAIPQHREHNPYAPRCATFHHCNPPGPHLGTRRLRAPSRNSSIPSPRGRFSTSLSLAHRNTPPPFLIQPRSCTLLQCLASFRPALPCLAHAAHIHKETPPSSTCIYFPSWSTLDLTSTPPHPQVVALLVGAVFDYFISLIPHISSLFLRPLVLITDLIIF